MLEVRGAHPDEVDAAIACCGRAFGDNPQSIENLTTFFSKIHKHDPNFNPANSRIAVLDGEIVSVVQIFDRQMLIGGTPVRMGGLGSVGTLPEHRGKGYGTLVLQDCVAHMEREGYDLSLLFTGINDYYARVGWRTFEHVRPMTMEVPANLVPPDFNGEIRPIRWDEDLEAVMAVHAEFNRDATGSTVRSPEFWMRHEIWYPFDKARFFVAERDGRIVGYVRGDGDWLEEVCALDGEEDAAVALILHSLAGKATTKGRCPLATFHAGLERCGVTLTPERARWWMFRIIRFVPLLEKLLPQMEERRRTLQGSQARDWRGSVVLRTEVGAATLRAKDGGLSVESGEHPANETIIVRLTHAEMIDFLLGQLPASALWDGRTTTTVPQATVEAVLDTLFPLREYRWYPKDSF